MRTVNITILLAILLGMVSIKMSAHDIEVANADGKTIYYVYINNKTELEVSYEGSSFVNYSNEYSGNIVIPQSVTYNGKTYPVTSIGKEPFYGCSGLTSVTISSSVTKIGKDAFHDCSGLTSVTIPSSVTSIGGGAFSGCNSLTSVIIPSGVTSIGGHTFHGCSGLTSVTIPSSVTSIGMCAFEGCSSLTSVTIPSGVTSIEEYTFSGCSGLKSVTIPTGVKSIYAHAFENCSSLTSLTIGSDVWEIRGFAFEGCIGLTEVYCYAKEVPWTGVGMFDETTINDATLYVPVSSWNSYNSAVIWRDFKNIVAIEDLNEGNIVFSDSKVRSICVKNWDTNNDGVLSKSEAAAVTDLGKVFMYSPINQFDAIVYFTGLNNIGSQAFQGSSITSITIPSNVTCIDERAFYGCVKLTDIIISEGVTTIGRNAFEECTNLSNIIIPKSVAWIGGGAFYETAWYDNQPDGLVYAGNIAYNYKGTMPTNTSIILEEGTLGITESAFSGCRGLTSITIPDGVTSIGSYAFSYCSGLTSVTIPSSVTSIGNEAFSGCSGLTSLTIPSSVTSIGGFAFSGCSGLTMVTIPSSLTSIGSNPFSGCTGLTAVMVDAGNPNYDSRGGCNAIIETATNTLIGGCKNTVIPSSVTSIGSYAFEGCSSLTSLTIPSSVTSIGGFAFSGCSGLTSITILSGVTSIGGGAFSDCSGLTSVTIPSSVTSIENNAFERCNGLTSVTIPSTVTSIGDGAFEHCSGLTSATIPSSVTNIGSSAFSNCSSLTTVMIGDFRGNWNVFYNCPSIKNVTILDGATKIDDNAFKGFTKLENVVFGNTVKTIGTNAFSGCTNLKKMRIPSGVTTIGEAAFADCSSMTTVIIPNSVTSIGNRAFENCIGLTSINSFINVPKKLDESVFGCSSSSGYDASTIYIIANLYVPRGRTNLYAAIDGWKLFSSVAEKDVAYELTYVVDGEVYSSYELQQGVTITPEGYPVKYGYVFSGWDTVPSTMPDHDVVVYGSFKFATDLAQIEGEEVEHVFSNDFTEDTALQGIVLNNVYFNIDGSGYDVASGSILMNTPMSDEQVDAIVGKGVAAEEVANGYKGLIFIVPAGKGKIDVDVQTTGRYNLSVKVGKEEASHISQVKRGKVAVTYTVSEPTMVYIYASTTNGARSLERMEDANSVKLYGFKWAIFVDDTETGFVSLERQTSSGKTYKLLGVPAQMPRKGIYVKDGKKIVVK